MACLSHDLPTSAGLQEAIKRIIKQHQRDCENAGEFRRAREARAALQELQHQSELEGLCRLFCRHYIQLSEAEKAYEKHLQTLDMNWQTQQLPELLEKVRRWRQQLQERHEEELATLSSNNTEDDCTTLRPRFKKEACDLRKKVLFLGHQGRYDEAEEVQKLLAVRQRMDAAEQKAVIKARRERQARRLLIAQEAERHSLENKVERLVSYHNRQNAEAIDVLRRKYLGQRKSLSHIQALEMQKYLHALKSFTPNEAVRMASSVVNSQWKVQGKAQGITSSETEANYRSATDLLHPVLMGEYEGKNSESAAVSLRKVPEKERQTIEVLSYEDDSQSVGTHTSNRSSETVTTDWGSHGETRRKQRKSPAWHQDAASARAPALTSRLTGASTCIPRLIVPLRKSLTTDPLRSFHSTQHRQTWKCYSLDRHITKGTGEHTSQRSQVHYRQEASKRRSSEQVHTRTRISQATRLSGRSVVRRRSIKTEKPPQIDVLRDEILKTWKDCAAKVTKEQATAESLR